VIASDLTRARRTAEIVAAALGLGGVEIDPGWRERNVGEWSGLTRAEIEERWPGQLLAWREGRLERPPGGEAQAELEARVRAVIERAAHAEGAVLVVTHGGVIHTAERMLDVEMSRIGNLAGRWVEEGGAAGKAFTAPEESAAQPTNVL
jgi:probable phosphoglycerate mutase